MKVRRPSPAMAVALLALLIALGGSAAALPGKFTVGRDDLKNSSVGARALGKMLLSHSHVMRSTDPVAGDGVFTQVRGSVVCPQKAPTAVDPSIGNMSQTSFEVSRLALPNRWGGPLGYEFTVSSDEGPEFGYTMKVNCLFAR